MCLQFLSLFSLPWLPLAHVANCALGVSTILNWFFADIECYQLWIQNYSTKITWKCHKYCEHAEIENLKLGGIFFPPELRSHRWRWIRLGVDSKWRQAARGPSYAPCTTASISILRSSFVASWLDTVSSTWGHDGTLRIFDLRNCNCVQEARKCQEVHEVCEVLR